MNDKLHPEFNSLVPKVLFNRRDFVVTLLGAGFALAAQPVVAQQVISTDAKGLIAGEIRVPVKDGMIPAYRAQPDAGAKFPVVLVVSEVFGVHEYIADVCRRLAKLGYLAIAPEPFVRQGNPRETDNVETILVDIIDKVPDAQVLADLDACVAWAKDNNGDTTRLGVTGFCWGGRQTWMYSAHNPQVKAGVAWYGRLDDPTTANQPKQPVDIADKLTVPVLGLYGGQDQGIPMNNVEDMQKALKRAGGKSEIHVYPDAPHAFHADYRPSYRKETAEDGWKRMLDWFRKHGV